MELLPPGRSDVQCGNCCITFNVQNSLIRRGRGKFCTRKCSIAKHPVHRWPEGYTPPMDPASVAERKARRKTYKRKYVRKLNRGFKVAAMNAYGGRCACCGESGIPFLNIDHVDGKGAAHREEIGASGRRIYVWLKKRGYPTGFQVLCFNCNIARHWHGGVCPHKLVPELELTHGAGV